MARFFISYTKLKSFFIQMSMIKFMKQSTLRFVFLLPKLTSMRYKLLLYLIISVAVYACTSVAVTGRKQLSLVSNAEIIPVANQQYAEIIKKGPLSTDQAQVQMVKRVGARIQKAVEQYMASKNLSSELAGFQWEFNLIDDPKTVNAWCMPGGKVAFYTAIMPICKDETGVAVVMGHEVAHAIANHGRERMSQQMVAQFGMGTLGALMGENPTAGNELLMQAIGAGTSVGMLKFSREHESEADHIGLIFMAMAGYDPNAAPAFWERMTKMSGGQAPPEFLSTHPSHDTRINDLKGWIPEAMKYYKSN
jgi:predicted Zn-dependent protease